MKFHQIIPVTFALFILQLKTASAFFVGQDPIPNDDSSAVREFDFSIEYGTTRLYRGIKSSTNPYIRPSIDYAAPSGFYSGLTSYISLDSGNVDETDLSVGYEFSLSRQTKMSLEFIHYFFRNNKLANSLIKNGVELYLRHDFGSVLKSKLYFDVDFGNGLSDRSLTLDNSHDFVVYDVFADDSKMSIRPAFSLTAGSLNLVRKVKKDVLTTGFGLTNYDLSLSLEYEIGRFIIEPEAAFDFPVSGKQPLLKKATKSDPVFYFTASITYVID